ncbi:transglycosylase domain-containing protein [Luteolibacter marinus]|uniref:transglycosylase domain-containing protein n=1 Tax=Luteolibacter marinus TaxID=2776705 RepID=UPI001868CF21|nr:transglycosylase domain-containing protein [Luteolibacter marinus]
MAKGNKNTRNKLRNRIFFKRKGFWLTLLLMFAIAGAIGVVALERYTRPYRERADTYDLNRIGDVEIPSLILDRNGEELGRFFVQNRSVIPIDDVPQLFIDALRAGEDQRFETHDGVDYIGVVRAAFLNWKAGERTQGASTITQQLAKNAYNLDGERRKRGETDMQRKIVEAFLARRIERHYKKREILGFYLNRIYFGSGYYGIRSAALGYFGKEPKDLTALESAAIVACIKSPRYTSPVNNMEANRKARNMVLVRMVDLGVLRRSEARTLFTTPLALNPKPLQRGTTHLYERVADEVRRELGEEALAAGGFRIHTSIDGKIQEAMEKELERSLLRAEAHPGYANQKRADYKKSSGVAPTYLQGAALMVDHETGEVIAHVGGRDYADAPYDFIELGKRPLGTAFYPFLYAAGLMNGLTPATLVEDEPMDNRSVMVGGREGILGEWGMEVPRPTYEGKITLRRALEASKIAASVRIAGMAGLENVVKVAEGFGLPMKDAELLPRLAAGWEEASLKDAVSGIAAFARGGATGSRTVTFVDKVENVDGATVYSRVIGKRDRLQATDSATAYMIHHIMRDGMDHGNIAGLGDRMVEKPFSGAGKTGTTHDFSDNWFLGYNGRVACGVWVGFLQPGKSIYEGAFSKDLALPVWEEGMNAAAADFGGKIIPQPDSVVEAQICRVSGQRATPYCYETVADPETGGMRSGPASQIELFRKGSENLPFCPIHSGAGGVDPGAASMGLSQLAVIDTTPVRSKAQVLLGEDPYFTQQVMVDGTEQAPGRNRANVLDSFDLGDREKPVKLPWPDRLEIDPW